MARTVLVADDSKTIREIVKMALKGSSFNVVDADSARATMDAVNQRPDVILLDYYMPDASGYDLCRSLKGNDATRAIPVVMLGGTYKSFDEQRARQSGADGIVMKPFKTDQLLQAIEAALNAPAASAPQVVSTPPVAAPHQAPSAPAAQPQAAPSRLASPPLPSSPAPPPNPFASAASGARPRPGGFGAPSNPGFSGSSSPSIPPARPAQTAGSQPRIPAPIPQSSSPSIPVNRAASAAASQPRSPGDSGIGNTSSAPGLNKSEMESFVRDEVKRAVREELPGLLRSVMGDLFQQKILPRLVKHSEDKISQVLNEQLAQRIQSQVRVELERLLSEE